LLPNLGVIGKIVEEAVCSLEKVHHFCWNFTGEHLITSSYLTILEARKYNGASQVTILLIQDERRIVCSFSDYVIDQVSLSHHLVALCLSLILKLLAIEVFSILFNLSMIWGLFENTVTKICFVHLIFMIKTSHWDFCVIFLFLCII
jgi:hypothetical protein